MEKRRCCCDEDEDLRFLENILFAGCLCSLFCKRYVYVGSGEILCVECSSSVALIHHEAKRLRSLSSFVLRFELMDGKVVL